MEGVTRLAADLRALLTRRQAEAYQWAAVGRWTGLATSEGTYPVHLQREADGKYVATIYRPGLFVPPDLFGRPGGEGTLYWRGESYQGIGEAVANAGLAMASWPVVEGES